MANLHTSIVDIPIEAGRVTRLADRVCRITAPNAGPMTGPGTNTYLVGSEDVTVIDPGPAEKSHIDAILAAGAGKIRRVAVTHTHPDHSPAAKPIAETTGARLLGTLLEDDGHQDRSFVPDQSLRHGDFFGGSDHRLEALHTPGHVGNHFCFYLREGGMLFTGDHIMQGATVVIIPPSGDMHDYMNSLRLLEHYNIHHLAPAHGHLMDDASRVVGQLLAHRQRREDRVVEGLKKHPGATLDELMEQVYADIDGRLYKVAKLSLWAHLLKLERDQRAEKYAEKHWLYDHERWRLTN